MMVSLALNQFGTDVHLIKSWYDWDLNSVINMRVLSRSLPWLNHLTVEKMKKQLNFHHDLRFTHIKMKSQFQLPSECNQIRQRIFLLVCCCQTFCNFRKWLNFSLKKSCCSAVWSPSWAFLWWDSYPPCLRCHPDPWHTSWSTSITAQLCKTITAIQHNLDLVSTFDIRNQHTKLDSFEDSHPSPSMLLSSRASREFFNKSTNDETLTRRLQSDALRLKLKKPRTSVARTESFRKITTGWT